MTNISKHLALLLGAAAIAVLPTSAMAQDNVAVDNIVVGNVVDADATTLDDQPARVERDDDNDFPWGLLGLLGLAGLLGRKKSNDRDIHVDARRDTRP